ncbi:MAG: hypothetical protein OES10_01855 [Gammaproteobacteria bacterium]|jgi:hypothetical protein|nr:hypothetical protein [Gammaproteobacteria bacterium]MDH3750517.1 hypothetical protein [Gammaproteobacteria bacterium]
MTYRGIPERISPLWLGIGISGSLIAILFVTESVLGRWDLLLAEGEFDALARVSGGILRDVRLAIVHCLLIGYLPAAFLHVLRSGRRTVLVLRGALDCTREESKTLAASVRLSARWLVVTGLIGLAFSFAGPYMVPPVPLTPWSPSTWSPEVAWHRIFGPATGLWTWWLGYAIVTVSVRMSRIAKKLSRIDLLDLSPLAPFTQQGLMNALLLIGLLSIWSLMMLETGFEQVMIMNGSIGLVLIALALLSPVRGVHRRICQSKEAALSWVNGEISKQLRAFESSDAGRGSGEMADLVAYRGLVESVPEWPFTTSTYTRLVLYALLPAASWGIGIVAEELVGRALL